MKIGRYALQIFDLLIKTDIAASLGVGRRYQGILCNNQLADKIHQHIQLFNIHTDGSVDYRL